MTKTEKQEKQEVVMKKIQELAQGEKNCVVQGELIVAPKLTKKQQEYFMLTLKDDTGEIKANIFDKAPIFAQLKEMPSQFYGIITFDYLFNNEYPNLHIQSIEQTTRPRVLMADMEGMKAEFKQFLKSIAHPELKKLVMTLFKNKEFSQKFFEVPASLDGIYSYEGGLLQSTLRRVRLAEKIIAEWQDWGYNQFEKPSISRDLIVVSLVLGEIGKTQILRLNENFFPEITEKSHIFTSSQYGLYMVQKVLPSLSLSEQEELVLLHTIGSNGGDFHRGGRALDPATTEARIVDVVGTLDWSLGFAEKAKLNQMNDEPISQVKNRVHVLDETFVPKVEKEEEPVLEKEEEVEPILEKEEEIEVVLEKEEEVEVVFEKEEEPIFEEEEAIATLEPTTLETNDDWLNEEIEETVEVEEEVILG